MIFFFAFGVAIYDKNIFHHVGSSKLSCTTTTGPGANKSCVFPFKFRSVTYNNCTTATNNPDDTKAWCSTKVDEFGNHVGGQGNWGHCEPKCQCKLIQSFPKSNGNYTP